MNARDLGKLVGSDPSLAMELLKLVNSSLYNRGAKISSIERAVSVLGMRALRNLALCLAVRNCVHRRELGDFRLGRFWADSLNRAVAARMLAERTPEQPIDPMEAFTAGLLQDLGVLALVKRDPSRAAEWMEFVDGLPDERREQEFALFGQRHDDLSKQLVEVWGLPAELGIPMVFHHRPEDAPAALAPRCRLARQAEALGAVLSASDKRAALQHAKELLRAEASMESSEVTDLLAELGTRVADVANDLGFRIKTPPSFEDILKAANQSLVEMNLSYEDLVRELEQTIAEKQELADELARRARELEQLSLTDELTKLPNRRALSGRLSYEVKRASRSGSVLFAIGDVDKFKSVNDTWGHDFGDVVLKAISQALVEAVRDVDMVTRMGGEEFGILFVGTDVEGATIACDRILEKVRAIELETPDGQKRSFSISLGLAIVTGPHRGTVNDAAVGNRLYKSADSALYTAKESGRDRLVVAPEPVQWADPRARSAA